MSETCWTAPHRFSIRVYWEDTDAGGVMYHAGHVRFFERGRTEFLRSKGMSQTDLRTTESGVFVVRSLQIDYLFPARLDDLLSVETQIETLHVSRMALKQRLLHNDQLIATATVVCVWVGLSGKPKRIPMMVREQICR